MNAEQLKEGPPMKRIMTALLASLFLVGTTAMSTSLSFADEVRTMTETVIDAFGGAKKTESETKSDSDGRTTEAKVKTTETKTDFFGGAKHKTENETKFDSDGKMTETKTETTTSK
jgi:hypothetical protein